MFISIKERSLKDIVSMGVEEVRKLIFDQKLKDIILEKCKNGTIHVKTQPEMQRYIEHGLSALYFDSKLVKEIKVENINRLSLVSILIMMNHRNALKWVLETTLCPLVEVFDSV